MPLQYETPCVYNPLTNILRFCRFSTAMAIVAAKRLFCATTAMIKKHLSHLTIIIYIYINAEKLKSQTEDKEDKVNLVDECFIVKMDSFPKDGPIAKAIVYFIVSKLNIIYDNLPQQAK